MNTPEKLENMGDFRCNKCGSPLWVVWAIDEEKPTEHPCYVENCDGKQTPDPNGMPDRLRFKRGLKGKGPWF